MKVLNAFGKEHSDEEGKLADNRTTKYVGLILFLIGIE